MDHDQVRDLFSEYMESDLDQERESEVRDHLESCEECKAEYDEFRLTFETFRSLPAIEPPSDLEAKIKKRIRARSRGKFFSATIEPSFIYRVPYEFISLILILIAMVCLWVMTTFSSFESQKKPSPNETPDQQIQQPETTDSPETEPPPSSPGH